MVEYVGVITLQYYITTLAVAEKLNHMDCNCMHYNFQVVDNFFHNFIINIFKVTSESGMRVTSYVLVHMFTSFVLFVVCLYYTFRTALSSLQLKM